MSSMVLAWVAVAGTYAVLFGAAIGWEVWTASHRPGRVLPLAAAYVWIPLGGALVVALLLRSALASSL
jgi:hypothetical protein